MAIGPSHFLRRDLDEETLALVWEHSVLPYLEEQFFAEPEQLGEFALEKLRRTQAFRRGGAQEPAGEAAPASTSDVGAGDDAKSSPS